MIASLNCLDGIQRHHSLLDRADRGVNYSIAIHEIIQVLLTTETFIFFTK